MSQCGYMRQSRPLDNEQQDYSLARCYSDELMAHMIVSTEYSIEAHMIVSTEYSIEKIGSLNFIGIYRGGIQVMMILELMWKNSPEQN